METQTNKNFFYFQSEDLPEIGDLVVTGGFGNCYVEAINPGELEVWNPLTFERGTVFISDCDLISRK